MKEDLNSLQSMDVKLSRIYITNNMELKTCRLQFCWLADYFVKDTSEQGEIIFRKEEGLISKETLKRSKGQGEEKI